MLYFRLLFAESSLSSPIAVLNWRRSKMSARALCAIGIAGMIVWSNSEARAQLDPAPPVNQPDMVAWQLFTRVSAFRGISGRNDALFETWASDADTFKANPQWPSQAP